MIKIKEKTKTKVVSMLAVFALLILQIFPLGVSAATVTIPDSLMTASESASIPNNVSNSITNDPSSLNNKQQGPQVNVTFSSIGAIQPGEKITATAVPSFFKDSNSKLFFTWYLKHNGCNLGDVSSANKNCDLDGDGKITVNDWKIAAAQIISSDPSEVVSSSVPSPFDKWNTDPEKNTNPSDSPNCYVQDPSSGLIYEMRRVTPHDPIPDCPSGYHGACASEQSTSCPVLNNSYDPTVPDSSTNTKTIPYTTGSFCAFNSNANFDCEISNDTDLGNYSAKASCDNNGMPGTPFCVKDSSDIFYPSDGTSTLTGAVFGSAANICESLTPNTSIVPPATAPFSDWLSTINPLFSGVENQSCADAQKALVNELPNVNASCTFDKSDNMCKHLFPIMPNAVTGLGIDTFTWMYSTGDQVGVVVEGDSTLPTAHADSSMMRMWAFSNNSCEALSKLGSDVDNPLAASGDTDNKNKRGFYLEGNGGATCDLNNMSSCVGFLTAEVDLNDCLEENLIDPANPGAGETGASIAASTVLLGVSPANPINDPGGNGDTLNISADTAALQNSTALSYTWSVQESMDGSSSPIDPTIWKDVTGPLESGGSFSAADITGIGKNSLAINLNINNPGTLVSGMNSSYNGGVFYLRVKVSVSDGGQTLSGVTDPISIGEQQNSIDIYPVSANTQGLLSLSTASPKLCTDAAGLANCDVTQNEIIGVKIPANSSSSATPFSWTINGNAATCSSSTSNDCNSGNVLFFPVLGNVGEAVDVVGTGVDNKGNPITVSRNFLIVDPGLAITSTDSNAWQKLVGYYTAASGFCPAGADKCADLSNEVLQTNSGNTVTLSVTGQAQDQIGFDWSIDGEPDTADQDKSQISFPISKMTGESYNIGVTTRLTPDSTTAMNNIRLALNKDWGISPEDAVEETQTANIQLDVVDGNGQAVAMASPTSFGASLITHLPEDFMFLLKISVTALALLLSAGLLFALIPDSLFRETE